MSGSSVAVVGATGAVGRTMLGLLAEREFPLAAIRLMASSHSAGRKLETPLGEVEVEDLHEADPSGIDVALFSAGADRSRQFAQTFVDSGAVVIDNSSAFRMDPEVPLVVVDVNDDSLSGHRGLIANPNCTTMTLMMAAAPLHQLAGLESVVVSSYQSVSGSGHQGVEELTRQVDELAGEAEGLISGDWSEPTVDVYTRPIGWNAIPFAGNEARDGYTDEEIKLIDESRKILALEGLEVEPTCVRIPVVVGHGVSATLRFGRAVSAEEASSALASASGVELWEDRVPTPLDSAGRDEVLVGRVRNTAGAAGGINLWAVGDNLRKGAALNAVQIAEKLVK